MKNFHSLYKKFLCSSNMDPARYWRLVPIDGSYTSEYDAGKDVTFHDVLPLLDKEYMLDLVHCISGHHVAMCDLDEQFATLTVTFDIDVRYRDPRGIEIVKNSLQKNPGFGTNWAGHITTSRDNKTIKVELKGRS